MPFLLFYYSTIQLLYYSTFNSHIEFIILKVDFSF